MDRNPVVAGQFYPGSASALQAEVAGYLQGKPSSRRTLLAMVPHAGYVFSGSIAGKTMARAALSSRIILMGPNHTGRGQKISVWKDGTWRVPGLEAGIDRDLAEAVLDLPGFSADYQAHLYEHSLEVILPFLGGVLDEFSFVPVAVSESDLKILTESGRDLGRVLKSMNIDVSLVVSTDMSHYISHEQATKIDQLAMEQILALDPEGLYRVVTGKKISMCGVLPMVMGLACVRELGASEAWLVDYTTSGEVNNDYSKVVGYAGILIS